ncbi:hypothetical protein J437_LFUL009815 [Ladona fulva]|uniref:Tyrosine-protein kinase n=1 Tax=Ladona fulva TaxID=123851 RepID=A0A8K0K9A9_LADFU|nr:hypothetical protein J437_LFUL009815 [Ladona fulva]
MMTRPKVVVALYPFKAIEGGDLSLEKGAEYEVLDDSQEHWWKVKDEHGSIGYIPSNYVKEKELLGLQKYEWYVGDMSRQRAESLLKQEDKEGCFVVRNSSTKGLYTLSLYTKVPHPHVKHYHIKQNGRGDFFLSEKHCCSSVPDLVNYHRHNSGGLASRLKASPCDRPAPPTAGLSHGVLMWEVFTCGKMPYGRLKNTEVVERVQRGIILERPKACFKEVYEVMRKCWSHNPEDRPSFRVLKEQLLIVSQGLLAD